jgi:Flp pilus assembly protein TadB
VQASPDEIRRKIGERIDRQQQRDDRQLKLRLSGYGVLLLLALACLLTSLLGGPPAVAVTTGALFVCGLIVIEVWRNRSR